MRLMPVILHVGKWNDLKGWIRGNDSLFTEVTGYKL